MVTAARVWGHALDPRGDFHRDAMILRDGERASGGPAHVDGFWIRRTRCDNAEFRRFVESTGYLTTAERPVDWEAMRKQLPPGTQTTGVDADARALVSAAGSCGDAR